jgi:2-(1,2-epoxy-1,2-dihydrophenyl)acetyl-CoA isomerase
MPDVLVARDGAVTTITLNRPGAMNAFDAPMAASIGDAIGAAAGDATCRVLVLTGGGRGFCAGADLNCLQDLLASKDQRKARELIENGARFVRAIVSAPQPVIAAVNGAAAGGGASLALACDVRIASADASIGAVFNRIGLHPDLGATYFLPRLIGFGRAMELVLSGEMVSASEAHRIGLFNRVVHGDALMAEARDFAQQLAVKSPEALARAKRSVRATTSASLDEALAIELQQQLALIERDDTHDALRAFRDRR